MIYSKVRRYARYYDLMIRRNFMRYPRSRLRQIIYVIVTCVLLTLGFRYMRGSATLSVIIVEEHHEALVYWIDAVDEGIIPRSDNTLIHIDAHSDSALPEWVEDFPLFRWPANQQEILSLLQKNDIFIMDAVMIGLIDRFIWIVPVWDSETREVQHVIEQIDLGYAMLRVKDNPEPMPHLCRCELDDDGVKECFYLNTTLEASPATDPHMKLHNALCSNTRTYTFEILHVMDAVKLLQEPPAGEPAWLHRQESIILDIDEDYFSVQVPGTSLLAAGIPWKTVQTLDELLSAWICPSGVEHEMTSQDMLADVLDVYVQMCSPTGDLEDWESCGVKVNLVVKRLFDGVLSDWWHKNTDLSCFQNDHDLKLIVTDFIQTIRSLSRTQLKILRRIGFCLNMTPKAYEFDEFGAIHVCYGSNDPRDLMVELHRATTTEYIREMARVSHFLHMLRPRAKLVTVARSSRDGYTPRDMVQPIEKGLLEVFLSEEFQTGPGALPVDVIYDEDLMEMRAL